MKNNITINLILYIIIQMSFVLGQDVVQDVNFNINDDSEMIINYTLNPKSSDEFYKISVSITSDGGKSWFSPKSIKGDFGKQKGYGRKQITWVIFDDRDELEGDVSIEVKAKVYLSPVIIGLGISSGLPGILNYNVIFNFRKINMEYSSGFKFSDNESKQLSIGFVAWDLASINLLYGSITFIGEEIYPTLYALNNNEYEYWGVALKLPDLFTIYHIPITIEMGAIRGDEDFYNRIQQGYIQVGTGVKLRF